MNDTCGRYQGMQFSSCSASFSPHSNLKILKVFCTDGAPAVVDSVGGVVLEASLIGEVTPPGLRGEGED